MKSIIQSFCLLFFLLVIFMFDHNFYCYGSVLGTQEQTASQIKPSMLFETQTVSITETMSNPEEKMTEAFSDDTLPAQKKLAPIAIPVVSSAEAEKLNADAVQLFKKEVDEPVQERKRVAVLLIMFFVVFLSCAVYNFKRIS